MCIYEEQAAIWRYYFKLTKNREAKVWFLSDKPSPYISSTYDLNSSKQGISIIDLFNGRRPELLNYNFYDSGTPPRVKFKPTVVLDSQIITYLTQYLKSSGRTDTQYKHLHSFLRFVVENGYDLNPFFYYLESIAKNGIVKAKKYTTTSALSVLQLHTMNEEVFLKENRIIPDRKRIEAYAARYGLIPINGSSLDEIAPLWDETMLSSISESGIEGFREIIGYTYAALLKMVLIHKASRQNVIRKMQKFWDFLGNELNLGLGWESAIAVCYFSNQLPSNFIQVQAEMSFANVRQGMLSTAWDLYLLRMPEIQLRNGTEQETLLCYICSADKAVRKLGRLFTIASVVSLSPKRNLPTNILFNYENLIDELGKNTFDTLCEQQKEREESRLQMLAEGKVQPISEEQLQDLISCLEDEIKGLCRDH